MERYKKEQRIIIVETHYKNEESFVETVCKLRGISGRNNAPNESSIQRLIKKFEEIDSIVNNKSPMRSCSGRSLENIVAVRENVTEILRTSIRHRSQELDVSRNTLLRILTKDLHLHAYKIQLT